MAGAERAARGAGEADPESIRRSGTGEDLECEKVVRSLTRGGKTIHCRVTYTSLLDEGRSVDGAILVMEEWRGASQEQLRRDEKRSGEKEC